MQLFNDWLSDYILHVLASLNHFYLGALPRNLVDVLYKFQILNTGADLVAFWDEVYVLVRHIHAKLIYYLLELGVLAFLETRAASSCKLTHQVNISQLHLALNNDQKIIVELLQVFAHWKMDVPIDIICGDLALSNTVHYSIDCAVNLLGSAHREWTAKIRAGRYEIIHGQDLVIAERSEMIVAKFTATKTIFNNLIDLALVHMRNESIWRLASHSGSLRVVRGMTWHKRVCLSVPLGLLCRSRGLNSLETWISLHVCFTSTSD